MSSNIFKRLNAPTELSHVEIPNLFLKECVDNRIIVPIYCHGGASCGCGFFAGDFFFTSGHVTAFAPEPYIVYDTQRIPLSKKNQILCRHDKDDPKGFDIAVYRIDGISSNLSFHSGKIEAGNELESLSFREGGTGIEPVYCKAIVLEDEYRQCNYVGIKTDLHLKTGCSGSPVFLGKNVVGIMTSGNNKGDNTPCKDILPLDLCYILSAESVNKALKDVCNKK